MNTGNGFHADGTTNQSSCPQDTSKMPIAHSTLKKITMSRSSFLFASSFTDKMTERDKTAPPFVLLGNCAEELPPPTITFNGADSQFQKIIKGKEVTLHNCEIDPNGDRDLQMDLRTHYFHGGIRTTNKKMSKFYFMTDLSNEVEMNIVGKDFQQWKGASGALSWLHPGLWCMSNVGFLFTKVGYAVGLHMEDLRFESANILFQGRKLWKTIPQEKTAAVVQHLNKKYYTDVRSRKCAYAVLHKNIWIGEKTFKKFGGASFIQERGDVVIVPSGKLHMVLALEYCVGAAVNFIDLNWSNRSVEWVLDCCRCKHKINPILSVPAIRTLQEVHKNILFLSKELSGCENVKNIMFSGVHTSKFFDEFNHEETSSEQSHAPLEQPSKSPRSKVTKRKLNGISKTGRHITPGPPMLASLCQSSSVQNKLDSDNLNQNDDNESTGVGSLHTANTAKTKQITSNAVGQSITQNLQPPSLESSAAPSETHLVKLTENDKEDLRYRIIGVQDHSFINSKCNDFSSMETSSIHGTSKINNALNIDQTTVDTVGPNFIATTERYVSTSSKSGMQTRKTQVYACLTCGSRFASLQKVNQHCISHNQDYECNACGLLLDNVTEYTKHRNDCHQIVNYSLSCETCGKSCQSKKSLNAHIKGRTCVMRTHICKCGKIFEKRQSLRNHERSHITKERKKCTVPALSSGIPDLE